MRILHVIHSVNPLGGGPIEGIRQLQPALAWLGIDTEVLSLDAPNAPGTTGFPMPLHAMGPAILSPGYGYNARFVPWLQNHRGNYDAVIVNGLWQYASFGVWRALRGTSTPYYVYPHGMLDPWFKRRYPLKHIKKLLYWPWAEYRVLRDATAVLFTSEEEKREARKSFGLYRCREEITGYGIAAPPIDHARQKELFLERYPELRGKRLILFLGRIHEKKGCDLLLRAWKEVIHDAGAASHLVMAGPTDSVFGAAMQDLGRSLQLDGRVTWTGMLTGDLKWGALAASDAFILPSHQENFGISVVEALACGVPALISNKVNIWREVVEDHAGLVEADDLPGTCRLLRRWSQMSTQKQEEIRSASQICYANRFDIKTTAKSLERLLKGV